ncbi:MAG: TatD family hydrolase [Myxococcota bacterium]|nr:TatD family hydrolase [Myxococcota bacterium]
MIDTHCHLDQEVYDDQESVSQVISRAFQAGVHTMICIGSGFGMASARRAVGTAAEHERVFATVGVHPYQADIIDEEVIERLRSLAQHPKVVAIGEMGLDYYRCTVSREKQREGFRKQIRLAKELGLPIVIHDRETERETFQILCEEVAFQEVGVLFHCFTGDVAYMQEIVQKGGLISIPGIITFKNAAVMREVVRNAPVSHLLLETDSPFLTPVPHRGKRNEPCYLPLIAQKVAQLQNRTVEEIERITSQNAERFFSLPRRVV